MITFIAWLIFGALAGWVASILTHPQLTEQNSQRASHCGALRPNERPSRSGTDGAQLHPRIDAGKPIVGISSGVIPYQDSRDGRTDSIATRGYPLACRIFCTSVSETTAWVLSDLDGMARACMSVALAVDIPAMNGV